MRDASDLIRLRGVTNIEAEVDSTGDIIWAVDIGHDHDGYGALLHVAFSNLLLSRDRAEDLGLALIRAAAAADAWNDDRARVN